LVGPKHCGKTKAGLELASELGIPFIDTDDEIKEREQKSPRELFTEGADVFRAAELRACQDLGDRIRELEAQREEHPWTAIISAGGGLVDNPPALEALRATGILLFLSIPSEIAWARVQKGVAKTGTLPPFLLCDDPETAHRLLHERRNAAYTEEADYIVQVDDSPVEENVRKIRTVLETFLTSRVGGLYSEEA